jgi:hypothetical protein
VFSPQYLVSRRQYACFEEIGFLHSFWPLAPTTGHRQFKFRSNDPVNGSAELLGFTVNEGYRQATASLREDWANIGRCWESCKARDHTLLEKKSHVVEQRQESAQLEEMIRMAFPIIQGTKNPVFPGTEEGEAIAHILSGHSWGQRLFPSRF